MRMSGIVNYDTDDVFRIFVKNAKRDFKNFDENNPIGCKVEKEVNTGGEKPIKCTVEITGFELNEKYEITTTNELTKCVSRYTFYQLDDGKTKLVLEETQGTGKLFQWVSLVVQRFLAKANFKITFDNIIDSLNNELRIYHENIERSRKK